MRRSWSEQLWLVHRSAEADRRRQEEQDEALARALQQSEQEAANGQRQQQQQGQQRVSPRHSVERLHFMTWLKLSTPVNSAIPPRVGAMSTSESWDVNRHTARCTSPVSVVWQCKLVSGWGLMKRRSMGLMAREAFCFTLCKLSQFAEWKFSLSTYLRQKVKWFRWAKVRSKSMV